MLQREQGIEQRGVQNLINKADSSCNNEWPKNISIIFNKMMYILK